LLQIVGADDIINVDVHFTGDSACLKADAIWCKMAQLEIEQDKSDPKASQALVTS